MNNIGEVDCRLIWGINWIILKVLILDGWDDINIIKKNSIWVGKVVLEKKTSLIFDVSLRFLSEIRFLWNDYWG